MFKTTVDVKYKFFPL